SPAPPRFTSAGRSPEAAIGPLVRCPLSAKSGERAFHSLRRHESLQLLGPLLDQDEPSGFAALRIGCVPSRLGWNGASAWRAFSMMAFLSSPLSCSALASRARTSSDIFAAASRTALGFVRFRTDIRIR